MGKKNHLALKRLASTPLDLNKRFPAEIFASSVYKPYCEFYVGFSHIVHNLVPFPPNNVMQPKCYSLQLHRVFIQHEIKIMHENVTVSITKR